MRVKEMRLLAHDIFFKNEYLRSSKIATVQKVFVCVYIYIYIFSLHILYVWTGMDDPTRRDAPLVLHNISRRYCLSSLQSLCIGSWHIMVIIGTGSESPSMAGLQALILPDRKSVV